MDGVTRFKTHQIKELSMVLEEISCILHNKGAGILLWITVDASITHDIPGMNVSEFGRNMLYIQCGWDKGGSIYLGNY